MSYAIWWRTWDKHFRTLRNFVLELMAAFGEVMRVQMEFLRILMELFGINLKTLGLAFGYLCHDLRRRPSEPNGPVQTAPPTAPPTTPPTQSEPQALGESSGCFDWAREKIRRRCNKIGDEENQLGADERTRPDKPPGDASNGTAEEGPGGEKKPPELDVPANGQNLPES